MSLPPYGCEKCAENRLFYDDNAVVSGNKALQRVLEVPLIEA
jgi:hypothetical protein